jgi:transcriptional regulator with XRE-family HTH domain
MSRPSKPPYGVLIEEARADAGLSIREAARRAGISDAWWRYVVNGRQGTNLVTGAADKVAAMARVVGLDPDRLETDGERPDAARILRTAPRDIPEPVATAVAPPSRDDQAADLFPHDPDRQQAWRTLTDPSMDDREKLGRIAGAFLWPDDLAQQKILVAAAVSRVTADEMAEMMQVLPRSRAENRARLLNPGGEVSA